MGKTAPKMSKAKRGASTRRHRVLTLKVAGQLQPGRIAIPDLLLICQHVQTTINRQAEAMEGGQHTKRRGPAREKVQVECTLELAGLRAGSPTAELSFELAKPQRRLPTILTFGEEVIGRVADAIESVSEDRTEDIDVGVLDSLNNLGEVFERKRVRSIRWVVPRRRGRKRSDIDFNRNVRHRVAQRLRPPTTRPLEIEGTVQMADFKPSDYRCRIHQVFGPPVSCVFDEEHADQIHATLRKPAKIKGKATCNAQTGNVEMLQVASIRPLGSLELGKSHFMAGLSFDELAKLQSVEPLVNADVLAGGWPDDDEPEQALAEIYAHRE